MILLVNWMSITKFFFSKCEGFLNELLPVMFRKFLGKDLTGMSVQELGALEQQLNEGLLCIKERKVKLFFLFQLYNLIN